MSIRTVVEFNNDWIDSLLREGHISEQLHRLILDAGNKETSVDVPGVMRLISLHHSVDYSISFDGFDFERHESA